MSELQARLAEAAAAHRAASAELHELLAEGRAELEAARREPLVTDEEKEQLQEVALRGDMGRDMQEFAHEVRRGRGDWERLLRGQDGRHDLLRAFLDRSQAEHGERVRQAFADSEAPPDVEDPRRL